MRQARKKPCRECPFRRKSLPSYLGQDTPEGFLATTLSDHPMPCHLAVDYTEEDWRDKAQKATLCAGALVFFANILKLSRDPDRPRVSPDKTTVFASPQEFLLHHKKGRP